MTTRRSFISAGLFLAGAAAAGSTEAALRAWIKFRARRPQSSVPVTVPHASAGLALSLKEYQRELTALTEAKQDLPDDVRRLHGLNCLAGFLVLADTDLVLFGNHDPSLPPMDVDDLAVVLRNAFSVSSEYNGAPGCTIDPTPGASDPWRQQIVKVFGMPPGASMGLRHIAIDYELKKVSSGLTVLHPSVASIFERSRAETGFCKADKAGSRSAPQSATHRFWFTPLYPDRPRFTRDGAGVLVERPIQVQLQSEEEFLRSGQRVGGAPPQPAAKEFAQSITRLLATDEVPAYSHLRNDFRLIEIAQIIKFVAVRDENLEYLLHSFPIRQLPFQARVTGIRRAESGEATCGSVLGRESTGAPTERIERYRQEFRGGVEAHIEVTQSDFHDDSGHRLAHLRDAVLRDRAYGRAVWSITS